MGNDTIYLSSLDRLVLMRALQVANVRGILETVTDSPYTFQDADAYQDNLEAKLQVR
jgi:hypothetical protein